METVASFINETIGREAFAKATGFSQQVISRAIVENIMPAGWYRDVRALCGAQCVAVPDHLFRWVDKRKSPANAQPVRAAE